jgi:hypothetical protein
MPAPPPHNSPSRTHLPVVELGQVDHLDGDIDRHSELEVSTVQILVLLRKAKDAHDPEHHPRTAVGEHLDVPSQNVGVQIESPVEVVDPASGGAAVGGGRGDEALDEEDGAQRPREDVHAGQYVAEFVVHQRGVEDVEVRHGEEGDDGNEVGLHPVRSVHRDVALGCDGRTELATWEEALEEQLEAQEATDHGPRRGIERVRPDGVQDGKEALPVAEVGEGEEVAVHASDDVEVYDGEAGRGEHQEDRSDMVAAGEDTSSSRPVFRFRKRLALCSTHDKHGIVEKEFVVTAEFDSYRQSSDEM